MGCSDPIWLSTTLLITTPICFVAAKTKKICSKLSTRSILEHFHSRLHPTTRSIPISMPQFRHTSGLSATDRIRNQREKKNR